MLGGREGRGSKRPWQTSTYSFPKFQLWGIKGWLSVHYSSPETFRFYLAALETRKLGGSPARPAPLPRSDRRLHRAAESQRRSLASFVLDLAGERLRRHWLSSPGSGLSSRSRGSAPVCQQPPAAVGPAETTEEGEAAAGAGPGGAICTGSAPGRQACPSQSPAAPCSLLSPPSPPFWGAEVTPWPYKPVFGS